VTESYEDITSSLPVAIEEDINQPVFVKAVVIEEDIIEEPEEPEYGLTEEEINLIALVTMAEAEGESELGKRLVISTILNRVDSELGYFPDTVTEVIYQRNQFSSMWNGRVDRCYVKEDICDLVKDELTARTNDEVLYFHANKFSNYGTPLLVEGNHYFSSI
jgi:N-acetylmuramoyl-L-alanine amidase